MVLDEALADRDGGRAPAPLPAPVHRPVQRREIRSLVIGRPGHRDRDRPQGPEAAHPSAADPRHGDDRRRDRVARPRLLQPAVDGVAVPAGTELAVSGVPQRYRGRLQLANQEVEVLRGTEQDLVHTGRITPVHPAAEASREDDPRAPVEGPRTAADAARPAAWLRRRRRGPVVVGRGRAADPLPRATTQPARRRAIERLTFDELFVLELGVGFRRQRVAAEARGVVARRRRRAHRPARRHAPVRPRRHAQRRAIEARRARDGRPDADEPAPAGRRGLGQDARRRPRVPGRDRARATRRRSWRRPRCSPPSTHARSRRCSTPSGQGVPRRASNARGR